MQVAVKASQRERQAGADESADENGQCYEAWLEVALEYKGRRGNWAAQVDGPSVTAFDLNDIEGRFLFWLGFKVQSDPSWRKGTSLTVAPARSTPQSLALGKAIGEFILEAETKEKAAPPA